MLSIAIIWLAVSLSGDKEKKPAVSGLKSTQQTDFDILSCPA
jgi:hypothetical protein